MYVSSIYEAIPLPPPPELHFEKGSYTDFVILIGIGVLIAIGMILALWKVGCIHRVSTSTRRKYYRNQERVELMSEEDDEAEIETREIELSSPD